MCIHMYKYIQKYMYMYRYVYINIYAYIQYHNRIGTTSSFNIGGDIEANKGRDGGSDPQVEVLKAEIKVRSSH
jgi:hypothetical protein